MQRKILLAGVSAFALAVAAGFGATAVNATLYDWTYSNSGASGSGTLTTSGGSSPFTATAITGTFDTIAISGLAPAGRVQGFTGNFNDNKVYVPASPGFLDGSGIGFFLGTLGSIVSIDFTGASYAQNINNNGMNSGSAGGSFTLTAASAVPEPSTLALLGVGLVGLGVARRRRKPA